jgi:hypothetical protein
VIALAWIIIGIGAVIAIGAIGYAAGIRVSFEVIVEHIDKDKKP